jgi:hypothetical protein
MASNQDFSLAIGVESVYKTGVAPTRAYEITDENLDWNPTRKQGQGLRAGSRVARSGRRVTPIADGGGDFTIECVSKGMGLLLQACFGTGVSTLVSGTTFQQVFTLGDTPSPLTIQKGVVEDGGTVDPHTFLGCMVDSFEFNFPNADIATLKTTVDAGDFSSVQAFTAVTSLYPTEPNNVYHFANASLSMGTLTAPTTTALASGATPTANIRDVSISVANNLTNNKFNMGGGGRKAKPNRGIRAITGKFTMQYDATTYRDLFLADSPMNLVLTYVTAGALSTGVETLQVVVPEIKFDGELPKANGTDLITVPMAFTGLDNLTAAQPIWCVLRTADTAL